MKIAVALAAALALSACSSIVDGTTQTLTFNSSPQGAECILNRNGAPIGKVTTPGGILVEKTKYNIQAVCSKDGYEDATLFIKSDVAGATLGNIILGGGIGWAIDSASGADNKYNEINDVVLVKKGEAAPAAAAPQAEPQAQNKQSTSPTS